MKTVNDDTGDTMRPVELPVIEEEPSVAIRSDPTSDGVAARQPELPFTPAVTMDPVDGSKIVITEITPFVEYQGRIFRFKNDANRRLFLANPQRFLRGEHAKY